MQQMAKRKDTDMRVAGVRDGKSIAWYRRTIKKPVNKIVKPKDFFEKRIFDR